MSWTMEMQYTGLGLYRPAIVPRYKGSTSTQIVLKNVQSLAKCVYSVTGY